MKKLNFISSLFLLVLAVSLVFSGVDSVGATSYYNWVLNPSFGAYENFVEDGGFESGEFESGVTYGNWSQTQNDHESDINTDCEYSGVYGLEMDYIDASPVGVAYLFSNDYNETLGADFVEVSFMVKTVGGSFDVVICYSDGSNDTAVDLGSATWVHRDITDEIDDSKYVWAFEFTFTGNDGKVDDVSMLVDTGDNCQDDITMTTTPWYLGQPQTQTGSEYFGDIDAYGRLDNASCWLEGYTSNWLIQSVPYLDSDNVHFVSLYASYCETDESVLCRLLYSDGTFSEKTMEFDEECGVDEWTEVNFGGSWVDGGKLIVGIFFRLVSASDMFYIDDVGLWCDVPTGQDRFTWSLSPSPRAFGDYWFEGWQGQTYTITGYVMNFTSGTYNENGTVAWTDNYGTEELTLVNGQFNFTLDTRSGLGDGKEEYIGLVIDIDGSDELVTANIVAYWYRITSGDGGSVGSSGSVDSFAWTSQISDFFVIFTVIGLPAFVLGAVTKSPMGMIVGLLIGASAGYAGEIVDLWFVMLVAVAMVALFLMSWRSR